MGNNLIFELFVAVNVYFCYNYFMNLIYEPNQLIYYMVFVTRYKRNIFEDREAAELVKQSLRNIQENGIMKVEIEEIGRCYISLKCIGDPSKSPNQIVSYLKRRCYQAMLEKMPHLNSLWSRDVIISTSPISNTIIIELLQTLKRRG